MDSFKESLKNWFGYTRRERRSTFILLIIILLVVGIRFIVSEQNITIEEISTGLEESTSDSVIFERGISSALKKKEVRTYLQQKPLLNITTCDSASLEALPGIGPVLSVRIIKYRNLLGGYAKISQLKEVYGLSEETYDLISGRFFADSLTVFKININNADYKDLKRLPYFEKNEVIAILKYRELMGRITCINDLIVNKLIPTERAGKVRPYLDFGE